ncbi:hypothetical protein IFDJLNFL_5473 [Methylobacterium dankookense]|uniref:Uncharacterized protein n=1 Tax=Methylobacterium dankookense TaxID=560405 RepID=A0ABQ4RR87_9HYPH|nr:hypothetical protein IFDJLNFL_5473 [Methylobacterium dankookense]
MRTMRALGSENHEVPDSRERGEFAVVEELRIETCRGDEGIGIATEFGEGDADPLQNLTTLRRSAFQRHIRFFQLTR